MMRQFVATTFCVHDNKLLLVHHKKFNNWIPPGGHLDENELPCSGAVREFKEETGLDMEIIGQEELMGNEVKKLKTPFHIQLENLGDHEHIDFIYFGKLIDPTQKFVNADDGINDIKWVSAKELETIEAFDDVKKTGKIALEKLR